MRATTTTLAAVPTRVSMRTARVLLLAACAATLLAACGRHDDGDAQSGWEKSGWQINSLRFDKDTVTIGGSDGARIAANGDLTIAGKPVTLSDAQRARTLEYHAHAMDLHRHAIETGKAGIAVGKEAVGAVLSGLAKGEPDKIGPSIEAKAEGVKQAALKLCDDLAGIRGAQTALAADVEAFRPYATAIGERDVTECRDGIVKDSGGAHAASTTPAAPESAAPAAGATAPAAPEAPAPAATTGT